ncbi:hypothetical protein [Aminobacter aminovorans]|uniref:Uncharacterized protein n=1 Tax=Aminobacter aminovorans TaxID=83263 RepID=A0ABR6H5K4_AMIAI|nr:hypothetical protein [Aminobacter aminovorans]MBB3705799.1 hypothetical protein [Aminobacter aminovorans]
MAISDLPSDRRIGGVEPLLNGHHGQGEVVIGKNEILPTVWRVGVPDQYRDLGTGLKAPKDRVHMVGDDLSDTLDYG